MGGVAAVTAAAARVVAIEGEIEVTHLRHLVRVRNALTPAHRARLDALRARRRAGRRARRVKLEGASGKMASEVERRMAERKCLVVEDSAAMRQLLAFALARVGGLVVDEADDGVAGLKKLETERYDLFVLDINMPIMDGLKLVQHIRADAHHAKTPVIIVTTEGASEDRERAMSLGASAYITKPIQARQVIETVKRLLPPG